MLAFCAGSGWLVLGVGRGLAAVPCDHHSRFRARGLVHPRLDRAGHYRMGRPSQMPLLAAAVGTMIGAALCVRARSEPGRWLRPVSPISIGAFVLSYAARLPPLEVIGVAALVGFLWVEA